MDTRLVWKGVCSKRKEFAPMGSKFFPFRADPFYETTKHFYRVVFLETVSIPYKINWDCFVDSLFVIDINILCISAKYYGNNIKYVGIQINTTIKYQSLGYVEGIPIMNKWEDFVNSEVIT